MLILRLGDPHVKASNIDEMDRLLFFIADTAVERKVDRIEILGDAFHTHAVLRLEVLDYWTNAFEHLTDICEVVVLVGNHDISGSYNSDISALDIFIKTKNKNLHIINLPRVMGPIGYMPYIHDNTKFVESANHLVSYGAKTLVCHGTFSGSKYENGFYAPDGVDPELLDFQTIISGHIHARQRFVTSKGQSVIYPGTAYWQSASDANQPKGLWLVKHDDASGAILSEEFISTENVCQPIIGLEYKEGEEMPIWANNARVTVELIGSSAWIAQEKAKLKGLCSIKTKITDKKKSEDRKTGNSFESFLSGAFTSTLNKERLLKYAKEIGIV